MDILSATGAVYQSLFIFIRIMRLLLGYYHFPAMTDIDAGLQTIEAGTHALAIEIVHTAAGLVTVDVQLADGGGSAIDYCLYSCDRSSLRDYEEGAKSLHRLT